MGPLEQWFPRLSGTAYRITSPRDRRYNCIAWAAKDTARWWAPETVTKETDIEYYWPSGIARGKEGKRTQCLIEVYEAIGYTVCREHEMEPGFEKVAIYSVDNKWKHAARQLLNGRWTSKIGRQEDIEHESPASLCGAAYGQVSCYMRRLVSDMVVFPPPG